MKKDRLVQLLSDAVRQTGYKVRTEEGNFRGGSCIHREDRVIFLNRRMTLDERAELLAKVLAGEDFESMYLLPEVRRYVENRRLKELLVETTTEDSQSTAARE